MSRRRRDLGPQGKWDFFSFPVYFGLAVGAFLSFLMTVLVGWIWFYVVVLLLAWAIAHFVNRTFIGRRQERARMREDEEERERRALAARAASDRANEEASRRRRRRPRRSRPEP